MAISGISQSVAQLNAYGVQSQGNDAPGNLSAASQQKNSSVSTDTSVQAKLSNFGQVKNALAELKASAQAVKETSQSASVNEIKAAVQNFVQSYNNLNQQVQAPTAQKPGAFDSDPRSAKALQAIEQALSANRESSAGALQDLGLQKQNDGSLALNQAALEKNLQTASQATTTQLGGLADRVSQAADRQLSTSLVNAANTQESSSSSRPQENNPAASQDQQEARRLQQQRLAAQLETASGSTARAAVSSYFSVASL